MPRKNTPSEFQTTLGFSAMPAGKWERLAAKRVRELSAAGYVTPATAGYADELRLAGRALDFAELHGVSVHARLAAVQQWDKALSRIVPPPAESVSTGTSDPWAALSEQLRATPLRDEENA